MSNTSRGVALALVFLVLAGGEPAQLQQWADSRASRDIAAALRTVARSRLSDAPLRPTQEAPAPVAQLQPDEIRGSLKCPALELRVTGLAADAPIGASLPWRGSAPEYSYLPPRVAVAGSDGAATLVLPAADVELDLEPGPYRIVVGYLDAGGQYRQLRGVFVTVSPSAAAAACR